MLPRTEPPQGAPGTSLTAAGPLRGAGGGSRPRLHQLQFQHLSASGVRTLLQPRRESARSTSFRQQSSAQAERPPPASCHGAVCGAPASARPSRGGPAHTTLQPARRGQPPGPPGPPGPRSAAWAAPPAWAGRGQGSGGAWAAARALIGRVPPGAGGGGRGPPGPALRPGPCRRRRAALGDCRASHRRLSPRACARAPVTVAPLPRLCLGQPCPSRHLNRPSQVREGQSGLARPRRARRDAARCCRRVNGLGFGSALSNSPGEGGSGHGRPSLPDRTLPP